MAIVLAVLGVGFVAFVGLLIGAVTFLGTSSEPEFTSVGSSIPDDDEGDGFVQVPLDPVPSEDDPSEEPPADPSAEALGLVADVLSDDDWILEDEALMSPEAPVAAAPCAPQGWQTGARDRAIGTFRLPDGEIEAPLTVVLVSYQTEDTAAADLERARSTAYQDCEVWQRQQLDRLDAEHEVTVLPEDPTAPGVAIAMTETGGEARTEYDHIIVVGRMRAQLDVCDCADFDVPYLRRVAADVAAAMAEVQGLPVPG